MSHEMERESGNTGRLNGNLYVMLKFTERLKTPGITSKKMAFPGGNMLLAGVFRAILDVTNADMVQFTKRWNWKWIVLHQGYFGRKFAATNESSAPRYVYHQGRSLKFI